MLLPEDTHPSNSLYFNGGVILKALMENGRELRLMDLYMEARKYHEMPIAIFVLALDWLFLAEAVSSNDNGGVKLCS